MDPSAPGGRVAVRGGRLSLAEALRDADLAEAKIGVFGISVFVGDGSRGLRDLVVEVRERRPPLPGRRSDRRRPLLNSDVLSVAALNRLEATSGLVKTGKHPMHFTVPLRGKDGSLVVDLILEAFAEVVANPVSEG